MHQKALVVDNDTVFNEFLSTLLEQQGYRVVRAYDGKEAIDRLNEGPVDIVFSELILTKIDGYEVFRFVREAFPDNRIPLVAVADTIGEQLGALADSDADFYIAKGPMKQMTRLVNEFLDDLENKPAQLVVGKNVMQLNTVQSRQATTKLLNALRVQKAVLEGLGTGVVVLDSDQRILHLNRCAQMLFQVPDSRMLCRYFSEFLTDDDRGQFEKAIQRQLYLHPPHPLSVTITIHKRPIQAIVSALHIDSHDDLWVMSLNPLEYRRESVFRRLLNLKKNISIQPIQWPRSFPVNLHLPVEQPVRCSAARRFT